MTDTPITTDRPQDAERVADVLAFMYTTAYLLVLPLHLLFFWADFVWYPSFVDRFSAIRLAAMALIVVTIEVARRRWIRSVDLLFVVYIGISAWAVHVLIVLTGDTSTPYYAGLTLLIVGLAAERATGWPIYAVNVAQLVLPFVAFGALSGGPRQHFWLNVLFLVSASLVSVVSRVILRHLYAKEWSSRLGLQREVQSRDEVIAAKTEEAVQDHLRRALLDEEIARAHERMLITEQVAHDIRSPLTALNVIAERASALSPDQRRLTLDAVERINTIANDLLSRARMDRHVLIQRSMDEEFDTVKSQDLVPITCQLVDEKRIQYEARAPLVIEIVGDELPNGAPAAVNAVEYQRVLSNLIDNGVQACRDDGRIRIEFTATEDATWVTVSDDGKGIPEEVLPLVAQRGWTYDKVGGSGLGLFHADRTAKRWGGALSIASRAGAGTVVTLRLPRSAPGE